MEELKQTNGVLESSWRDFVHPKFGHFTLQKYHRQRQTSYFLRTCKNYETHTKNTWLGINGSYSGILQAKPTAERKHDFPLQWTPYFPPCPYEKIESFSSDKPTLTICLEGANQNILISRISMCMRENISCHSKKKLYGCCRRVTEERLDAFT